MENFEKLKQFYNGRRVLVTGHTGFKGSYLTVLLSLLGAEVYGYALPAPSDPSLFEILYGKESSAKTKKDLQIRANGDVSLSAHRGRFPMEACNSVRDPHIGIRESCIGDIRDYDKLSAFLKKVKPQVVIHMAAQPIVRESYRIPRETYETNVMGTVNVLEALRLMQERMRRKGAAEPVSFLNVTTDKVYKNVEQPGYAYRETDELNGYDPYSNSKSCSELVTAGYRNSFFNTDPLIRISTARAGNVIGGGDFARDRIIPDCTRAWLSGSSVKIRNPFSTRPYQHVLEPLFVYLTIAMEQYGDAAAAGSYNVGPDLCDCVTTGELCDLFGSFAKGFRWIDRAEKNAPHEASFLRLDNTKIRETFGWHPVWHIDRAVEACVKWADAWRQDDLSANRELLRQLTDYVR